MLEFARKQSTSKQSLRVRISWSMIRNTHSVIGHANIFLWVPDDARVLTGFGQCFRYFHPFKRWMPASVIGSTAQWSSYDRISSRDWWLRSRSKPSIFTIQRVKWKSKHQSGINTKLKVCSYPSNGYFDLI